MSKQLNPKFEAKWHNRGLTRSYLVVSDILLYWHADLGLTEAEMASFLKLFRIFEHPKTTPNTKALHIPANTWTDRLKKFEKLKFVEDLSIRHPKNPVKWIPKYRITEHFFDECERILKREFATGDEAAEPTHAEPAEEPVQATPAPALPAAKPVAPPTVSIPKPVQAPPAPRTDPVDTIQIGEPMYQSNEDQFEEDSQDIQARIDRELATYPRLTVRELCKMVSKTLALEKPHPLTLIKKIPDERLLSIQETILNALAEKGDLFRNGPDYVLAMIIAEILDYAYESESVKPTALVEPRVELPIEDIEDLDPEAMQAIPPAMREYIRERRPDSLLLEDTFDDAPQLYTSTEIGEPTYQ